LQGFQLTFFTQQDRQFHGKPLAHWLVEEARAMGIGGATLVAASEGFGHHRHIHSVRFVELADQPVDVIMVVTAEESDRLFAKLHEEKISLFYSKTPIEFGTMEEEE
jgi:PII-like signaling protein